VIAGAPPPARPARVILVPPSAFADGWGSKPSDPIAIGLRRLSEGAVAAARAGASEEAVTAYKNESGEIRDTAAFWDAFNDALLQRLVAAALCDPNDVHAPHPLFPLAVDMVPIAFAREGLLLVWHELERLTVEASTLIAPLSDDGVAELVALLQGNALERLPRDQATPVRRLLAHVLGVLATPEA
jgi:hypothetical protein